MAQSASGLTHHTHPAAASTHDTHSAAGSTQNTHPASGLTGNQHPASGPKVGNEPQNNHPSSGLKVANELNVSDGIVTALSDVPSTLARPVPVELEKHIKNPGLPRANAAVSKEVPEGSSDNKRNITVLQQHLEFFDRNKDGIIYPWETFAGFRALGFNILFAIPAVLFIHGSFAYPSQDSWIPSPFFGIHIKNAHRLKHGSDSGTYDTEGRFVPEKFEEIFSKFDRGDKKALTWNEFWEFMSAYRNINDPAGWIAAKLEWGTLYLLAAKDGMVSKEVIRRQYDGTLFYQIEHELAKNKREKKSGKIGRVAVHAISQGHPKHE